MFSINAHLVWATVFIYFFKAFNPHNNSVNDYDPHCTFRETEPKVPQQVSGRAGI